MPRPSPPKPSPARWRKTAWSLRPPPAPHAESRSPPAAAATAASAAAAARPVACARRPLRFPCGASLHPPRASTPTTPSSQRNRPRAPRKTPPWTPPRKPLPLARWYLRQPRRQPRRQPVAPRERAGLPSPAPHAARCGTYRSARPPHRHRRQPPGACAAATGWSTSRQTPSVPQAPAPPASSAAMPSTQAGSSPSHPAHDQRRHPRARLRYRRRSAPPARCSHKARSRYRATHAACRGQTADEKKDARAQARAAPVATRAARSTRSTIRTSPNPCSPFTLKLRAAIVAVKCPASPR
ncbi:hypothetical protein FHX63_002821 [Cupriavidus plantarum]|nr:hypothetical protein [Cupriavidus plantarum]